MPVLPALAALPLWVKLFGALTLGQLGLSAYEKAGQRGLQRTQLGLEEKALLGSQRVAKITAKEKRRAYESNIREMKSIMGQRESRAIRERQLETQRAQQAMDMAMVNQMIQALMTSRPAGNQSLMPATSIIEMLGRS